MFPVVCLALSLMSRLKFFTLEINKHSNFILFIKFIEIYQLISSDGTLVKTTKSQFE